MVTAIIAIYGAVLATINAGLGIFKEYRDRANVKVDLMIGNFLLFNQLKREFYSDPSSTLRLTISVTNIGRRPVQIVNIGGAMKTPKDGRTEFVIMPNPGVLPKYLTEHQTFCELINGKEAIKSLFDNTKDIFVIDVAGRRYFADQNQINKIILSMEEKQ